METSDEPKPRAPKKKKRSRKGATAETQNKSGGDQVLANSVAFLRCTFWYLELCASISEGDIGRVFEILKVKNCSHHYAHIIE